MYKRVDVIAVVNCSTIYNISWMIILYLILYILYFNNYILSRSTIYVILATHKRLPEYDVLRRNM